MDKCNICGRPAETAVRKYTRGTAEIPLCNICNVDVQKSVESQRERRRKYKKKWRTKFEESPF